MTKPYSPTLSVITVVYNNVRDIERTIQSVLNQTYPHIEYIVIDGGSNDGTVPIIETYVPRISKFISERDNGIYDGMNKGLGLATGDYVLFMNSGDEIYNIDTVAQVFATAEGADIYYGETELYDADWHSVGLRRHAIPEHFTWRSFRFGMNISHQAIYIRRSIAGRYDPRYQLSADIDWVIRAAKHAHCIINTKHILAKYLVGGISQKRHWKSLKERFAIFSKHYGLIPNIINHFVIGAKLGMYYLRHGKTND